MTEDRCFKIVAVQTSTGYGIEPTILMKCPECGYESEMMLELIDDKHSRQCPKCGFKGPLKDGPQIIIDEIRDAPTMNFGQVLEAMKADPHRRFARKGWNGRGIFISLQVPDEKSLMTRPYIFIDTTGLRSDNPDAPRDRVPWLASQTDMLSDDWYEVKR